MRTSAFSTPETAMATQHTRARAENLVTAVGNRAGASARWLARPSTATSPPTHSEAATTCTIRLSVARSCEPPAEECQVDATGISPTTATASSTNALPQLSATRQPANTTTANTAVNVHAVATSSWGTTATNRSKLSTSVTGRPRLSATVSGTMSRAPTVQAPAA